MVLKGADILVRSLIDQGCEVVFGYPGGSVIDIYDSLYRYQDEITHILTSHEQHAAHAADGYARATGKVGVCIATSGPGCTNLVTGIATAFLDSVPLVAITGNVATANIGTDGFQEIDITGITLPITKHNYFVSDISELADVVREAFEIASSDRPGPVLVDIAKDVQVDRYDYQRRNPVVPDPREAAGDEGLAQAATIINNAKRPFIYVGGGALASEATKEVIALSEAIDAPIGNSLMATSLIPSDTPRFLGLEGMHGHYSSTMAIKEADCIIALGARFNDRSTGDRTKFARKAKVVRIDIDESELSKTVSGKVDLHGDVKLTLQRLYPLIKPQERPDWAARIAELKEFEAENADVREGMTPKNVMLAVNEHLEPEMTVTTDVGQHQMWAAQYLRFARPRTFLTSGGLGTMGFGMGAAIGAHFGTNKRSVLVIGDGGFAMCLNDLATAVTNKVPLTVILLNNSVLGMVRQWQRLFYEERFSNTTLDKRVTDYVALAKAFGAGAQRVTTTDELGPALEEAFASDTPYLVECVIDKDELVMPMLPPGGTLDDIIVRLGD
ncbi:MAG: biosynthetic-type acetolactate synthase large subunit [Atopobiaceae bacterium]|nr:biosynthetic-type acetolactate synthase large subunit [Atopobiaceae bacterium]